MESFRAPHVTRGFRAVLRAFPLLIAPAVKLAIMGGLTPQTSCFANRAAASTAPTVLRVPPASARSALQALHYIKVPARSSAHQAHIPAAPHLNASIAWASSPIATPATAISASIVQLDITGMAHSALHAHRDRHQRLASYSPASNRACCVI